MMNRQVSWSFYFSLLKQAPDHARRIHYRSNMYNIRREAALERIVARQKREIEAQAAEFDADRQARNLALSDILAADRAIIEQQARRIAEMEQELESAGRELLDSGALWIASDKSQ